MAVPTKEEAVTQSKSFSKSPLAYLMSVAFGAIVSPTGLAVSPLVLFLANKKAVYINKRGKKVTPIGMWITAGIFLIPLCWVVNRMILSLTGPSKLETTEIRKAPVQFGIGDDAAAWLSRCTPPESDTSTAYDIPRPPIITRFLSYPTKGVRIVLVPGSPAVVGTPPPYSSWKMVGVTDPRTNQPIEPAEALRRMGDSCKRD